MGMFDWVRSSYQLPEPFMGVNQTKDIEECGLGGTMTFYYIDPSGYLWHGSYSNTHTFEIINEDDPRYDSKYKFLNFEWIPTGENGTWSVFPITKYIEIYPVEYKGNWEDWPRLRIHFKNGKLQDYQQAKRNETNPIWRQK